MSTKIRRLEEILLALNQEIEACNLANSRKPAQLKNGRSIQKVGSTNVFEFTFWGQEKDFELGSTKLSIASKEYDCEIISFQSGKTTIAVYEFTGSHISSALLQKNKRELLNVIKERFEFAKENPDKFAFEHSENLFNGQNQQLSSKRLLPNYSHSENDNLNISQERAVEQSLNQSLSVLWGPPGTGKTNTIAKMIEAHLNAGRRVLFVSHANMAVDGALKKIVKQVDQADSEQNLYKSGKTLRIGKCQDQELLSNYPLLNLDNVCQSKSAPLLKEKAALQSEQKELSTTLSTIEKIVANQVRYKNLELKHAELSNLAQSIRDKHELHDKQLVDYSNNSTRNEKIEKQIAYLAMSKDRLNKEHDKVMYEILDHKKDLQALEENILGCLEKIAVDNTNELSKFQEKTKQQHVTISNKIKEIDSKLAQIEQSVLRNAKLVASTITQTFTSLFTNQQFDVLIVDEVSMVPLPHLYWAMSKISKAVTLIGDFKQLPPIGICEKSPAADWFKKSIFDVLGICTTRDALADNRVTMLDTQYRMAPKIAEFANQLCYGGKLINAENTNQLVLTDSISANASAVLINTSPLQPASTRETQGSRKNVIHAMSCIRVRPTRAVIERCENSGKDFTMLKEEAWYEANRENKVKEEVARIA